MNNKRNYTNNEAFIPNDETISGIRHLTMGSIALLSKTGNKLMESVLSGEEIDFETNREDTLQFIWAHVAPKEEVTRLFLLYRVNPIHLDQAVAEWSLDIGNEQIEKYLVDILFEQTHIKNAESEIIPENGAKKN